MDVNFLLFQSVTFLISGIRAKKEACYEIGKQTGGDKENAGNGRTNPLWPPIDAPGSPDGTIEQRPDRPGACVVRDADFAALRIRRAPVLTAVIVFRTNPG